MEGSRSQAAMETFLTWGWAFLALAFAIAALAYFGVFSNNVPSKCVFEAPEIRCADFSIFSYQSSFVIQNIAGNRIESVSLSMEDCGTLTGPAAIGHGDMATYTIQCNLLDNSYSGTLNFTYTNSDTSLPHTTSATVTSSIVG